MEQNINIINVLEYAPVDKVKLYSVLHGKDLVFKGVYNTDEKKVFHLANGDEEFEVQSNGSWIPGGECVIFPDKQCRNWENWQYWLFRYSIGSVIIDHYCNPYLITEEYFVPDNPKVKFGIIRNHKMNLTDARYASPLETVKYFEKLEKNGYFYDKVKDQICPIELSMTPDKFYICTKTYEEKSFIQNVSVTRFFKKGKSYKCTSKNTLIDNNGNVKQISCDTFTDHFRKEPWSFSDAKRGDVLVDNYGSVFIFDCQDEKGIYAFCGLARKSKQFVFCYNSPDNKHGQAWISKIGDYINTESIKPASNIEKQTLYLAMKEAGYTFDKQHFMLVKFISNIKTNKFPKPFVGMLLKNDPKRYTDPFNMKDKEEYLSRVFMIVHIDSFGKATLAPINTRSVVTLGFVGVEDACPIHEDVKDIPNFYIELSKEEKVLYDPSLLETLDPVLVKNLNCDEWKVTHFSHIRDGRFVCEIGTFNICIPFNLLTKHLVGTTKDPIPIYNMKIE